jgi:NAD(P)H-nitrite reductase large subunit
LRDGRIFVRDKQDAKEQPKSKARAGRSGSLPEKVVIVGGGGGGLCGCRKTPSRTISRTHRYAERMMTRARRPPEFIKDYLAGTAQEDWVPLRPDSFYRDSGIELELKTDVTGIDVRSREVVLADARRVPYDWCCLRPAPSRSACLLPGANLPHVRTLRSLADCRAIIERAKTARRAVVMARASSGWNSLPLCEPEIEVHVVAPSARWSASWVPNGISCVHCTRSTA